VGGHRSVRGKEGWVMEDGGLAEGDRVEEEGCDVGEHLQEQVVGEPS
jgi:hypothetical protein